MRLLKSSGSNRVHVLEGKDWTKMAGTDFWLMGGPSHAGAAGNELITDFGWTETSVLSTAGASADLISAGDVGTPNSLSGDALNDLLLSPSLFGDYIHAYMASQFLGYIPSKLCLETYARFTTASANETTSGFGFSTGSSLTATNHVAFIHSDSANIAIRGTDGTGALTDTGGTVASVGTTWHIWKIVMDAAAAVQWYMDGSLQGSITLKTDMFPTAFSLSTSTTNRAGLAWLHIWYE